MERLKHPEKIRQPLLRERDIAAIGLERAKIEALKGAVRRAVDRTGEYFDEEEFSRNLKEEIENAFPDENDRRKIFDYYLGTDKKGKERLKSSPRQNFESYFRHSPEKKGISFREQIENYQELRFWLFLSIKEEELKNKFSEDFLGGINQREAIYFRLFPPSIVNFFKKFVGGKPMPIKFKSSEMLEEYKSYIGDFKKGKNKITFWFKEDLLPDEFRTAEGKIDEDLLEKVDIKKRHNTYEFSIYPEDIENLVQLLASEQRGIIKEETEFIKLLGETKDLYKEVNKLAPKEIKDLITQFGSLIVGLEEAYVDSIESGRTKEEIEKLRKNLDLIKNSLSEIKKDLEDLEKKKEPDLIKKVGSKIKDFLKDNGPLILASLGLWGLTIGWFLPLWMISKMYKSIEKGPLMKK